MGHALPGWFACATGSASRRAVTLRIVSSAAEGEAPRITLIGKPDCHLCDVAKVVVRRVADDTGAGCRELSILDDPGLAERYWEQIPVILVDGAYHAHYHVDEAGLRKALAARRPRRLRR